MDAVKYVIGYVVRYMVYVYMKNLLFISVSHFPEHLCARSDRHLIEKLFNLPERSLSKYLSLSQRNCTSALPLFVLSVMIFGSLPNQS